MVVRKRIRTTDDDPDHLEEPEKEFDLHRPRTTTRMTMILMTTLSF